MSVMVLVVCGDDAGVETGAQLAESLRALRVDASVVEGPATVENVTRQIHARTGGAHDSALAHLTRTERRTLRALAHGRSAEQVAMESGTSITTVRTHIRNILGKLNVHSQREAIAMAMRSGWIDRWELPMIATGTS
jgi:DNA-binding NarL/FixJ family response regulator